MIDQSLPHDSRTSNRQPTHSFDSKETLVAPDYPSREAFARLTAQEEELGLYADTARIGTRQRWEAVLAEKVVVLNGHVVVRG